MAYTKYSLTPANNNAAPPDGAPEGMLPSAVNDTMRDMMAQIRDCGDGIRGGTYTMTAPVITGGSINGAAIGASSASTGKFSALTNTALTSGRVTYAGTGGVLQDSANLAFDGTNLVVNANANIYGYFKFLGTTTPPTGASIYAPSANTIALSPNGAEAMRIDSSNNVGIGTTTPSSYFTGAEKLVITKAGSTGITIDSGATGNSNLFFAKGTSGAQAYAGWVQYANATDAMIFGVNAAERMRIDSNGNLLLGTTGVISNSKLSVYSASGPAFISATTNAASDYSGIVIKNTGGTAQGYELAIAGSSTGASPGLYVYNQVAGNVPFRFNPSGNIVLLSGNSTANGSGIVFPATQNASSDANTLDDYEEGTFTPTITAASGSLGGGSLLGSYTKIGRLVYVSMNMTNLSKGTLSGQITVGGLPFSVTTGNTTGTFRYGLNGTPASGTTIILPQSGGGTVLELQMFSGSGYLGNLNTSNLGSTFEFYNVTYIYQTS